MFTSESFDDTPPRELTEKQGRGAHGQQLGGMSWRRRDSATNGQRIKGRVRLRLKSGRKTEAIACTKNMSEKVFLPLSVLMTPPAGK